MFKHSAAQPFGGRKYFVMFWELYFSFSLSHEMELGLMLVRRHVQNIFLILEDTAFNLVVSCQQALWAFLCHENANVFFIISTKAYRVCILHITVLLNWTDLVQCFCWLSTWFLFSRLLKQFFFGVKALQKAKGDRNTEGPYFHPQLYQVQRQMQNQTQLFQVYKIKKHTPSPVSSSSIWGRHIQL